MSSLIDSKDIPNFLLDKATSSGLVKTVADNGKGFVVSPEVLNLLNKLLKSDDENATGDAQLLCELFSGERVSYRYASEKRRNWVQCSLFYRRSNRGSVCCPSNCQDGPGTWFTWPILVHLPYLQDTEDALSWRESQPLKLLTDAFLEMFEYHGNWKVVYKFTDSAQILLHDLQSQEIHDIDEGNPPLSLKRWTLSNDWQVHFTSSTISPQSF